MSQCKKFAPNIFHKTKCSNCFRQKEEHTAEALECNRASRSIARSGYLFVAPDWDFSVPLNRTKRWQRRWFVLYDDGELNYSVDEHPDTIPQGSVDMSQILEVTGAEQITGHPHSLALTGPDRVTFVKAASREDARWWAELLAVFPRRHKRNATFPGGRASPSLPQLGRSASPQPPRPRHLSCTGPSPRTNFTTPPLKEERERESPVEERGKWEGPEVGRSLPIETSVRTDYNVLTSGSPPTRDKLRCEDKARARRDWRNERLRDIATALTDRSPESSLALPAEGLLHLKKGWLWVKDIHSEWLRRWIVLCGPALTVFRDQDESAQPELTVEMANVISYGEITTESKYGFQIQTSTVSTPLVLSAVTAGIRSNWLQALKKAAPHVESPSAPATPRSVFLSSDEEYRTASEGGRRGSEDWGELPPSPPLARTSLARVKEKARARPRLPRCQSRQSTLDSVSTDELDTSSRDSSDSVDLKNTINKQKAEIDDLQKQLAKAVSEIQVLEEEINRLKKLLSESLLRERNAKDVLCLLEESEKKNTQLETKYLRAQKQLIEMEAFTKTTEDKYNLLTKELQNKQLLLLNLKEELRNANETITKDTETITNLQKQLKPLTNYGSLTNLTNINLDLDLDSLTATELIEYCLDLKTRFEKAILEIRAVKRELKESYGKCDDLELRNVAVQRRLEGRVEEMEAEKVLLVARIDHLTSRLTAVEKQARSKARQEAKDKRRSLSLKGRESFSINKEVEDKVTELEAKILTLERNRPPKRRHKQRDRSSERNSPIDDRSLRRLRRKSLDSATASESMKLLMRLSSLENKVSNVAASNESLNVASGSELCEQQQQQDGGLAVARDKLNDCLSQIGRLKSGRSNKRSPSPSSERLSLIEHSLSEVCDVLNGHVCAGGGSREAEVVLTSANGVVKQLQELLVEKLTELSEKRRELRAQNKLDVRAKVALLAEKIAFENVLIGRIQEALYMPTATDEAVCGRLLAKEAKETAFLIDTLKNKLLGTEKQSTPTCKTGVDYLTGVLASILSNTTQELLLRQRNYKTKTTPSLNFLRDEQNNINALYETYKRTRLPQLAESLANESVLDEETVKDFTKSARATVNRELIDSEINHVMLRAAQLYESRSNVDNKFFFTFFASERAALELWADSVETRLYNEISACVEELREHYVNALGKLQRQNWRRRLEWERGHKSGAKLLAEFADIVAHKSLIDARLSVLNGQVDRLDFTAQENHFDLNSLIAKENHKHFLQEQSSVQMNQSLEAEFKCMLDRYSGECLVVVERPEVEEVLECFGELCCEVNALKNSVGEGRMMVGGDDVVAIESLEDVCRRCVCLIKELEQIRRVVHGVNVSNLAIEEDEEKRPVFYGTEYLNQMENLRSAYRKAMAACMDHHTHTDLEKLQNLCERVLIAMEQWHRRTVQDLRESHSRELALLRQDKEQALAEETQATLAALDAMRKAHEAEVQREVARFKQDFVRQQRDELMELSERLSVKCLEAAALEEQLSSATRQLAHAQQHILQLERNPQLSTVQN